ncbi:hypothetical protein [Salinibacterium sp. PAMC 21357]|uniref:hypothetical protein n=1 Tax=Salinibacterium sp. PAMC 21357 TaxID=1112215 RepID=UPI0004748B2E|nr:hypothetical protein [Salinibacterium sp. PAMC 21357]
MRNRTRLAPAALVLLATTAVLTACSSGGSEGISILNESSSEVIITTGTEELVIAAEGATVLLGVDCIPDDVRATFASGATETIAGPICSDQELFIPSGETETMEVRPAQQ